MDRIWLLALVNGAKAVLADIDKAVHGYDIKVDPGSSTIVAQEGREEQSKIMAVSIANAYVPFMIQTGMVVPKS